MLGVGWGPGLGLRCGGVGEGKGLREEEGLAEEEGAERKESTSRKRKHSMMRKHPGDEGAMEEEGERKATQI